MRVQMRRALLLAVAIIVVSPVSADGFRAAVSGYSIGGCYFLPFHLYMPSVEWVSAAFDEPVPAWTDDIQTIGSADGKSVFALLRPSDAGGLRIALLHFTPSYPNNARTEYFQGLPNYFGTALAVAKTGRLIVVVRPKGDYHDAHIAVIASGGALEQLIDVPQPISKIAAAPDGCTLLYASGATIRRMNICTAEPMADFATVGEPITDVVALAAGDVLVSTSSSITRRSVHGAVIQAYVLRNIGGSGIDELAVSSDESVLVAAAMRYCDDQGQLVALSVSDGHELWRQETSEISIATGLVVGSPDGPSVPALSSLGLIVLVAALAGAGLVIRCY